MEEDGKSLENKAKEFLKLRMEIDPLNRGFNPIEIKDEDLPEYVPLIVYLVNEGYLMEGKAPLEKTLTAKSLRYQRTPKGDEWALG